MTTFTFTILDMETGQTYTHNDLYDYEQHLEGCPHGCTGPLEHALHSMLWQWGQGNYGCDCNRGWFVLGEDVACGHKRFKVTQVGCDPDRGVWYMSDPRDDV